MNSALKLVAFARGDASAGILALLETALAALDDLGDVQAAAIVDVAITAHRVRSDEIRAVTFADLAVHE